MVRVRIAPSPTGYPHIGTIYQALFDYAFAKKHKGKFFLRLEDTDRARFVADAEEKLYWALDWFGLTEDESPRKDGPYGPYRQSERLYIYKKYAKELIEKGGAYYCFCSKERLQGLHEKQQKARQPTIYDKHCRNLSKGEVETKLKEGASYIIRLKVPEHTDVIVRDEIRGDIHFDSDLIEDTVLLKADGYPTYHLASSVVDDHVMKTTHVVRGEEWLPSLPKHIVAYNYFGWKKPLFFHTPVLRNPDRSKLSKRHGHTNVAFYQEEGFLPEAILNFLALMAWSHPEGKEIFSLDEFIRYFELKDLKPVAPIFDIQKLRWMNGEYIRMMTINELAQRLIAWDPCNEDDFADDVFKQLVVLAQTRMNTLKDFDGLTAHFVNEPEIRLNDQEKQIEKSLSEIFIKINTWEKDSILLAMREVLKIQKVKGNVLYKILTGIDHGLPLPESLVILGKKKVLERLKKAVS